jgi:hypothetical protein
MVRRRGGSFRVGRGGGLFGLLVWFDSKSLRFRKLDGLLRVRVCLSVCLVLSVTVSYVDVGTFEVVV